MTRIRVTTKTTMSQPNPEPEKSLLERAADFVGSAAAYVAHEIMPDARRELVEKAWFGAAEPERFPQHARDSDGRLESWLRTTTVLTIDEDRDRGPSHSPDLDIDR